MYGSSDFIQATNPFHTLFPWICPLPNPAAASKLNSIMNNRIWVIILVLVCVGLGVSVVAVRNKAAEKQHQDAELIGTYSNKWAKASSDLDEEQRVRAMVEKDLD